MRNARGIDSMTQSLCNIQASISKMEDSGDFDQTSCAGDSHAHPDDSKRDGIKEIERTAKRSWAISVLVVMLGAMASGGFLYLGITSAHKQEEERFERHAHDLAKEIISSWRDYETAALWIHESCRDWRTGSFTRQDFRVLYNYLIAGGLDFFLAEWVPNITHAERPILEAEAAAYYANDPNVEYKGFVGIQPNPNNPEEFGLFPRTDEPIYFPIHFLEPYERIGEAAHLDLYSIIYERLAIDEAIQKFQPVLTERFTIVSQDTHGYSVSLIHPGVALPSDIYVEPRDLSLMLIHIRSLLERASRYQGVSLDVYLFDATKTLMDESPQEFLGGSRIEVLDNGEKHLTYYDEVELDEIEREAELCYSEKMEVGARTWTIVVVPANDDYQIQLRIAILCSVMIFAASVLLAWIWIIHNRKRSHHVNNIINKAAAESAIVSSLFPANVRALLIQQNQNVAPTKSPEQAVLPVSETICSEATQHDVPLTSVGIYGSMPIAEHHPHTTIMFADLTGFTSWSSHREPAEVFSLLETVYHAFDSIAKKRRIFKVETVGDCYVAAAGLPTPRKDHAVAMAKFANDCLHKMFALSAALRDTFGEDTVGLSFRVGLHSGPVTAGVLRGQKGRFQLFGDTVNMASRMESTGVKNKIQVSEATAKLLIAAGYDRWLTPREDVVHAKGKGDLRTFFVTNNEGSIATFSHPTHQFSSTDAPALMGSTSEDGEMQDLSEAVQKRLVGMQALPKERV